MPEIFSPPTSYETCKTLMGQTLEIDGVERHCNGCGLSGNKLHLSFADGSLWTQEHGLETKVQLANRLFDAAFAALPKGDQELVRRVFPDALVREDRSKLKQGGRLVLAAKQRLIKEGKIEPRICGRCLGSGHYSYNQTDGTCCFGCRGSGKAFPATRACLEVA